MTADPMAERRAQVEAFVADHFGPQAVVGVVEPMPGHAGLTFGFDVEVDGARQAVVVRVPPKGVRRSGATDVLRQVPLLRALHGLRLPVAPVRFASDDERWFEVPFFMTERLPGRTFNQNHPEPEFAPDPDAVADLYRQTVEAMVRIHAVDWARCLPDWDAPRSLAEEIRFWDPVAEKAAEARFTEMSRDVRERLLATIPANPSVGLFHGDLHTDNVLFHEGRLVAVLDWEISGIGATLLDLAWLIMFNDPACWDAISAPSPLVPTAEQMQGWYEEASGAAVQDLPWFRALAAYRFGVISGFNLRLHRKGQRRDEFWEDTARSIPSLFGQAQAHLQGSA